MNNNFKPIKPDKIWLADERIDDDQRFTNQDVNGIKHKSTFRGAVSGFLIAFGSNGAINEPVDWLTQ